MNLKTSTKGCEKRNYFGQESWEASEKHGSRWALNTERRGGRHAARHSGQVDPFGTTGEVLPSVVLGAAASWSPGVSVNSDAMTEYHRLGGLDLEIYFPTVLEAVGTG